MKAVVIFSLFCVLCFPVFTQEETRDPFISCLPDIKVPEVISAAAEEKVDEQAMGDFASEIDNLNIEGILWNSDIPMTIIDGEVLRIGDTVSSIGAKVHKITKNEVHFLYEGSVYMKQIGKKEAQ